MKITGVLAIGTGEKCPYCVKIMEEDTDTVGHLLDNHKDEMVKALFETED